MPEITPRQIRNFRLRSHQLDGGAAALAAPSASSAAASPSATASSSTAASLTASSPPPVSAACRIPLPAHGRPVYFPGCRTVPGRISSAFSPKRKPSFRPGASAEPR